VKIGLEKEIRVTASWELPEFWELEALCLQAVGFITLNLSIELRG
jgi:hypothetical protein